MIEKRKVAQEIKRITKKKGKNFGILNRLTLFVPSGTTNMVIFLKSKSGSHV